MSSNASRFLASVEKFDRTNWEDWSYSVRSTFRLTNILNIAEGKEKCPTAASTPGTEAELRAIGDWDRRNNKSLGLIQPAVKSSIRQAIKQNENLAENWKRLQDAYGTHTRLNLWIDIMKYFNTIFFTDLPLTQQINEMSDLRACIDLTGMLIADSLHTMLMLRALPMIYEVVGQTILAKVSDYKTLTSTNM